MEITQPDDSQISQIIYLTTPLCIHFKQCYCNIYVFSLLHRKILLHRQFQPRASNHFRWSKISGFFYAVPNLLNKTLSLHISVTMYVSTTRLLDQTIFEHCKNIKIYALAMHSFYGNAMFRNQSGYLLQRPNDSLNIRIFLYVTLL